MFDWIGAIGSIILIDLVLSGDNALVIGATASYLPKNLRWRAIVLGGGMAIVLRVLFTIAATFLLQLPLLQAIGGVILLFIAVRILAERDHQKEEVKEGRGRQEQQSFWSALLTIMVADVTMSLDNVLAIGAIASGEYVPLIIGLLGSIGLILVGSAMVATLIARLPLLLDLASLVLAWTAGNMLLNDIRLGPIFDKLPWTQFAIPALALGIVLAADIYLRLHGRSGSATRS